jgi:hypothetical protein
MWNCLPWKENVNKVVFWLRYKILNHYNCTYGQKSTEERRWQVSNVLETIEVQDFKKWEFKHFLAIMCLK